jgi:hypothetical protein
MAAQLGSRLTSVLFSSIIVFAAMLPLGIACCLRAPETGARAAEDTAKATPKSEANRGVKDKKEEEAEADEGQLDPLGANAACYVCHMTYVKEELSKIHLKEEIGCIECHGTSAGHANDENIGATKPDVTFKREQVGASCRECHPDHNAAPETVIARWIELGSPKQLPVCTDCHGKHRIEKAAEEQKSEE